MYFGSGVNILGLNPEEFSVAANISSSQSIVANDAIIARSFYGTGITSSGNVSASFFSGN